MRDLQGGKSERRDGSAVMNDGRNKSRTPYDCWRNVYHS